MQPESNTRRGLSLHQVQVPSTGAYSAICRQFPSPQKKLSMSGTMSALTRILILSSEGNFRGYAERRAIRAAACLPAQTDGARELCGEPAEKLSSTCTIWIRQVFMETISAGMKEQEASAISSPDSGTAWKHTYR